MATDSSPSSTVQICSESKRWSGPDAPAVIATSHIERPAVAPMVGDARVVITPAGVSEWRRSVVRITGDTGSSFNRQPGCLDSTRGCLYLRRCAHVFE